MKKWIRGLESSISMFSILPMATRQWADDSIRYILLFFPMVGLILGGIHFLLLKGLLAIGLNRMIQAFIIMAAPFFLSGFLHMDGFCDTCDAWFSRKDLAARRTILKDSAMGVFAGCGLVLTLLLWFCCAHGLVEKNMPTKLIIFMPAISRCVAALSVMSLDSMSCTGLGALFKQHRGPHDIRAVQLFFAGTALLCYVSDRMYGLAFFGVVAMASGLAALLANNSFNGFSGDLAGFSIVIGETAGMVMLGL